MICVDASVAAKWIFPEEYSRQSAAIVRASTQTGERIVAPAVLIMEVTNTIRRRMLRDHISLSQASRLLGQFAAVPITIAGPEAFSERALALADSHKLPAVYDAYYVALAEQVGCELWTDDHRLLSALGGKLPFVKWIGDYPLT